MTESIQILMEKDRLQPLADNIKVLKGSDTITLQQMEDTIEETNADIVSQTDLIAQLMSALQGKSVPDGGASVETCTVTMNHTLGQYLSGGGSITYTAYDNGTFTTNNIPFTTLYANRVLENVVCGSAITIYMGYPGQYISSTITGNTSQIYKIGDMTIYQVTNEAGASDTITIGSATS